MLSRKGRSGVKPFAWLLGQAVGNRQISYCLNLSEPYFIICIFFFDHSYAESKGCV